MAHLVFSFSSEFLPPVIHYEKEVEPETFLDRACLLNKVQKISKASFCGLKEEQETLRRQFKKKFCTPEMLKKYICRKNPRVVKAILSLNPKLIAAKIGKLEKSPLWYAAQKKDNAQVIKVLVDYGADAAEVDQFHRTKLLI